MDYKPSADRESRTARAESTAGTGAIRRHVHWLALAATVAFAAVLVGIASDNVAATRSPEPYPASRAVEAEAARISLPLEIPTQATAEPSPFPVQAQADAGAWRTVDVRRGDTLGAIFARIGLTPGELQQVLDDSGHASALTRIYPGETFKIRTDDQGRLLELVYDPDETHTLHVVNNGGTMEAELIERPMERRIAQASGVITSSLFGAGQEAGLSDAMIMKLAEIFGYDIDFALDIREGDRFSVVFEQVYVDGNLIRDGEVLAAEFTNRDKSFRALRYTDPNGRAEYYAPDGASMRKAFLRTPVEFTRISSRFSLGRKHPILNRIRAHKGVDYAAPTGTPVKSTSDGVISFVGTKGGYGKVVVIQHGRRYSTLYGHLSRFAKGMRTGTRVRQGQTIAYVGMSGLATGPHLHYEFRVDGAHRNPLTIKFIAADPLPAKYKADFRAKTQPLTAKLDLLQRLQVAASEQ